VKYLLQKMNLALGCELNEKLYLDVFDTIRNLPEISSADFRLTVQLMAAAIKSVSSRREKRRRRTTEVYHRDKFRDGLMSCIGKTVSEFIDKAVTEDRVRSIYQVVDILLVLYLNINPSTKREEIEIFEEKLAHICTDKKLQKVSRQHLDVIITALNHSNRQQSYAIIHMLKEIRNNDKLSSYHENIIIKRDKRILVKKGSSDIKWLFTFQHPGTGTCTESDSKCGFILRESKQDATVTLKLCTNSEDYRGTGLHYHDIISADDMFWYVVSSGNTPAGIKITVASLSCQNKLLKRWFPDIPDWKLEQVCIAYNITDYLVAKPE
jgi:hypothetical protein